MSGHLASADWASTRGERWGAQLESMEAMLAPVNDPLIEALQLDPATPCSVADLGCGGGGATLAIAECAAEGVVVRGYDISPVLIELARKRGGAEFHVADLSTAPPAMLYDRLTSRFGIMFFDDPEVAFGNLRSWLAPKGRFAFAAWASPSANPWMKLVKDTVAEFIEVPPVDPEAPGPFRYADAAKLIALLRTAGFDAVEVKEWRGKLPVGGGLPAPQAAQFALESFSSLADWIKSAEDREAMVKATEVLTQRFANHLEQGLVRMDARVHVFTGTRGESRCRSH